jgi:hypothetical protein
MTDVKWKWNRQYQLGDQLIAEIVRSYVLAQVNEGLPNYYYFGRGKMAETYFAVADYTVKYYDIQEGE